MPSGTELVVLAVAAVGGFALLEVAIRNTYVATVALMLATAVTTTWDYLPQVHLGGARIDLWDAIGVVFLSAAAARLLRRPHVSVYQWLLIAFGLVAFSSLALGIPEYGLNPAVNEFRKYFWFVAIALYYSTVAPDDELLDRIATAWMALAGYLVMLALLRWAVLPLGLTGGVFGAGEMRVLVSSSALFLLQAFIIGAVAWAHGAAPHWMRRLTPVLLATVVLMQHRSVWAALLMVTTVMVLRDAKIRRRLVPMLAMSVVAIAAVGLTVLDDEGSELPTQLAESAAYRVTWEWRVAGWQALIAYSGPRDVAEQVIGRPFGTGWDRVLDGRLVSVSPHNFYVETFLRTGVLGLGFFMILYAVLLWRLASHKKGSGLLQGRVLLLLLLAQPIYFVPYSLDPVQALVLGLAITTASVKGHEVRVAPGSSSRGTHERTHRVVTDVPQPPR